MRRKTIPDWFDGTFVNFTWQRKKTKTHQYNWRALHYVTTSAAKNARNRSFRIAWNLTYQFQFHARRHTSHRHLEFHVEIIKTSPCWVALAMIYKPTNIQTLNVFHVGFISCKFYFSNPQPKPKPQRMGADEPLKSLFACQNTRMLGLRIKGC